MTTPTCPIFSAVARPELDWETLCAVIEEVSVEFPLVATDLLGPQTIEHVHKKLPRYSPNRPFRAWVQRVVTNRALDLVRRERVRSRRKLDHAHRLALRERHACRLPVHSGERHLLPAAVRDRVRALRNKLDRRMVALPSSAQLDLHAILLLNLRLEAASLVRDPSGLVLPPSRFIAKLLPWKLAERDRRFRPTLPTLRELWTALTPILDADPRAMTGELFCEVLSSLGREDRPLKVATWRQWCLRARRKLGIRLEPQSWSELLSQIN